MGRRMRPQNEEFFALFSEAGSNVVESVCILMEFVAAPSAGPLPRIACVLPGQGSLTRTRPIAA